MAMKKVAWTIALAMYLKARAKYRAALRMSVVDLHIGLSRADRILVEYTLDLVGITPVIVDGSDSVGAR